MGEKKFVFNLKFTGKLLTILITGLVFCITACKKDESVVAKTDKIYWGNAIYGHGMIIRDNSTYQLYPDTLKRNACLILIPRVNDYMPYTETNVGSTIDFAPVGDNINGQFEYYYLYNIANPIKGYFTTTTNVSIDSMSYGNIKLYGGTITLNMDNSINLEYTDSIIGIGSNHYNIRYTK